MKRAALFCTVLCFSYAHLNAQLPSFGRGETVLNVGAGLGSTWYSGIYYETKFPPVSAALEFGVAEHVIEKGSIGVGPYIAYSTFKYEYRDGGYNYSIILAGLRGNFHYPLVSNLDTYASLFLGYNAVNSVEIGTASGPPESGGLRSAFYIGGRYYFAENFAVLAEIGYGVTYFNAGLAVKFW
jgi:hypothetical protein